MHFKNQSNPVLCLTLCDINGSICREHRISLTKTILGLLQKYCNCVKFLFLLFFKCQQIR